MATLTIRNLPPRVIKSLKAIARRNHRSMEQEVREIVELHVGDRLSAIDQIERAWKAQKRTLSREEVDAWVAEGRR